LETNKYCKTETTLIEINEQFIYKVPTSVLVDLAKSS